MIAQPRTLNTINVQNPMSVATVSQGIAASGMQVNGLQQTPLIFPRQTSQMSLINSPRQMAVVAPAAPAPAAPVVAAHVVTTPAVAPVVQTVAQPPPVSNIAQVLQNQAQQNDVMKLKNQALQTKLQQKNQQINTLIGVLSKNVLQTVANSPVLQGVVNTPAPTVAKPSPPNVSVAPTGTVTVAPAPPAAPAKVVPAPAPAVPAKVVPAPAPAAPAKVVPAPPPAAPAAAVKRTLEKQQKERDLVEDGRHFPGMSYVYQRRALGSERGGKINFDISSLDEVREARKLKRAQAQTKKRGLDIIPVRDLSAAEKSKFVPRRARIYPQPLGSLVYLSKYNKNRRLALTTVTDKKLKPLKRLFRK